MHNPDYSAYQDYHCGISSTQYSLLKVHCDLEIKKGVMLERTRKDSSEQPTKIDTAFTLEIPTGDFSCKMFQLN